nr:hypothetical protein Iba_chr06bCG12680 [Ipomoea batatas]
MLCLVIATVNAMYMIPDRFDPHVPSDEYFHQLQPCCTGCQPLSGTDCCLFSALQVVKLPRERESIQKFSKEEREISENARTFPMSYSVIVDRPSSRAIQRAGTCKRHTAARRPSLSYITNQGRMPQNLLDHAKFEQLDIQDYHSSTGNKMCMVGYELVHCKRPGGCGRGIQWIRIWWRPNPKMASNNKETPPWVQDATMVQSRKTVTTYKNLHHPHRDLRLRLRSGGFGGNNRRLSFATTDFFVRASGVTAVAGGGDHVSVEATRECSLSGEQLWHRQGLVFYGGISSLVSGGAWRWRQLKDVRPSPSSTVSCSGDGIECFGTLEKET